MTMAVLALLDGEEGQSDGMESITSSTSTISAADTGRETKMPDRIKLNINNNTESFFVNMCNRLSYADFYNDLCEIYTPVNMRRKYPSHHEKIILGGERDVNRKVEINQKGFCPVHYQKNEKTMIFPKMVLIWLPLMPYYLFKYNEI